jgi:hypothetical protein
MMLLTLVWAAAAVAAWVWAAAASRFSEMAAIEG